MQENQLKRRFLFGAVSLLGVGALGLSGCAKKRHPNYHYKITLNFESEGRIYSGASVVEVEPVEGQTIGQGYVLQEKYTGEGVLVDFGGGRVILSLLELKGRYASTAANLLEIFGFSLSGGVDFGKLAALRESRDLTIEQLPVMITFDDVANPASYRIIEVSKETDSVLPGIRFVSATVEITDEKATFSLEKKLPALKSVKNYLSGKGSAGRDMRWVAKYDIIRRWW